MRNHELKIRTTVRGPVISDHEGLGPKGDKVLVLRSTDAEVLAPQIGVENLLTAPSAAAFDQEVQKIDLMLFNFVFGDDQGNIAQRATGAVPIRKGVDGGFPRVPAADGTDDWTGWIPKDRMPGMTNPARGWVGTANHDTRPDNYPWYYTNYVAPSYRYTRMGQVLDNTQKMTVQDHWALMDDNRNLQSDALRPAIVTALKADPAQADFAALLEKWDGVDRGDAAAPLIYQALYREIALGTFTDELGESTTKDMLSTWYFWQQRFDALLTTPDSIWFDDIATKDKRETLADVIRSAAPRARAMLEQLQGKDVNAWRWSKAHLLRFVSPLRRKGPGQELVGGFSVERPGSGETLNRGVYDFQKPFDIAFFASMQVVVDFGDPDKINAVLAGGVSERHFQSHQNDQAKQWVAGQRGAWWFNPEQVKSHAVSTMTMTP
jgi:penicillin amidase